MNGSVPPRDGGTAPPPPTVLQTFLEVAGDRVVPTTMPKTTLAILCRTVEDLVLHDDLAGAVLTAFQDASNLHAEADRYEELAAADDRVVAVFARGEVGASQRVRRLRLPDDHPLTREWLLLALTDRFSAAVFGRELVDPTGSAGGPPLFLAVWSFDPTVVADVCATLATATESLSPAAHRTVTAAVAAHPPRVPAVGISQRVVNTVLDRMDARRRRWRDRALDLERELARRPVTDEDPTDAAAGPRNPPAEGGRGGATEPPGAPGPSSRSSSPARTTTGAGSRGADAVLERSDGAGGRSAPAAGGGGVAARTERAAAAAVPAGGAAPDDHGGQATGASGARVDGSPTGPVDAGSADAGPLGEGRGSRALIVDDDAAIRGLVEALLRRAGWEVTAVADRDDALRAASSSHYEVLLVDVNLHDDDGPDLLAMLENESPGSRDRAAFMTGSPPPDGVLDGRPVLAKPFAWSDLEAMLQQLTGS